MRYFLSLLLLVCSTVGALAQSQIYRFDTLSALTNFTIPIVNINLTAVVAGRSSTNDGLGAIYIYQTNRSDTVDGWSTLKPATANGRWLLMGLTTTNFALGGSATISNNLTVGGTLTAGSVVTTNSQTSTNQFLLRPTLSGASLTNGLTNKWIPRGVIWTDGPGDVFTNVTGPNNSFVFWSGSNLSSVFGTGTPRFLTDGSNEVRIVGNGGPGGTAGGVIGIWSTNSNAGVRNWGWYNSADNFGDLSLRQSAAQYGDPSSAASRAIWLTGAAGALTLNSGLSIGDTTDPGDNNLRVTGTALILGNSILNGTLTVTNNIVSLAQVKLSASTNTTAGQGATGNTQMGMNRFAQTSATLIITNTLITTASFVMAQLQDADAVGLAVQYVTEGSGVATINLAGTTTDADTDVKWWIWNPSN